MSDHMPYDVLREAAGRSTESATLRDAIDALEQAEKLAELLKSTALDIIDRLDHMTEARDNARAEVERLTEAVRALHQPVGRHNFCGTCAYAPWPCPTYRALEGEADR